MRRICELPRLATRTPARVTQPTHLLAPGAMCKSMLPPSPLFTTSHCIFLPDGAPIVGRQAAMMSGLLHRVSDVSPTPPNPKMAAPPLPQSCADARLPFGHLLAPSLFSLSPSATPLDPPNPAPRGDPPSTRDAADHRVEIVHTNAGGALNTVRKRTQLNEIRRRRRW
jgi:hypothetical protein